MTAPRLEADVVRRAASNYGWLKVFRRLAPELDVAIQKLQTGKQVPCPKTGNGKTKFRLFKDADETGGGIHNDLDESELANGLSLLMWLKNWNFREALEEVASVVGVAVPEKAEGTERRSTPAPQPVRKPPVDLKRDNTTPDPVEHGRRLNELWAKSISLTNPAAEIGRAYLASRGITEYSPYIRFCRLLPYWQKRDDGKLERIGSFPALVAKFYHADMMPVAIHRIYLTNEGTKLPVDDAKKTTAMPDGWTISGAAVRLDPPGPILCSAEGLETALSVRQVYKLPTWACTTANIVEALVLPPETKLHLHFADRDRSGRGERAGAQAKRNAWEQGVQCRILLPPYAIPDDEPKGIDFNDVLVRVGPSGFPDLGPLLRQEKVA